MFEIVGKTNIDFLGKRNHAFAFSGLMVLLGLFALVQVSRGQANMGIDFSGGTAVQMNFDQYLPIEKAREVLLRHGFPDAELQEFTGGNKLLIRVKALDTIEKNVAARIIDIFETQFSENKFVLDSSTEIGPTIGRELKRKAVIAVFFSIFGIVFYVAARFEFRFGVAAAAATFHDVLAVLGILYLLDKEINLLTVTALLTLAGYSLTDTVVVFDRIRENLRFRRRETLDEIINNGINQVLSRTLVVSLTAVLVLVALFFFGGEVIHDFSFTLLVGIIIGTYSSIFVASPILVVWKGSRGKLLRRV